MTNSHSFPVAKTASSKSGKRIIVPPIPFDRPVRKELSKEDYVAVKLRNDPEDPESQTTTLNVPIFKSGAPEDVIWFAKTMNKIFFGQHLITGPNQFAAVRRYLDGDALAAFNNYATSLGEETPEHCQSCLQALIAHVMPQNVLKMQKRYMRRFMRKAVSMTFQNFATRAVEINNDLVYFPGADGNSKLSEDELLDIFEYSIPATWQNTMVMHDFDPINHSVAEMIEFCE
jgi:hypothetical protein